MSKNIKNEQKHWEWLNFMQSFVGPRLPDRSVSHSKMQYSFSDKITEKRIPRPRVKYKDFTPEQKAAQIMRVLKRQERFKFATPRWADKEKIKEFYVEAQTLTRDTGIIHEVDHIVPIQGKLVSGLHVETNLRVLTKDDNRAKYNHHTE